MVAGMVSHRPKVMVLARWLLVTVNILAVLSPQAEGARIKSKLIGDLSAEEVVIDEAEKILEGNPGRILSMKKAFGEPTNPKLFFENPALLEEEGGIPFAVGPKDPRFHMPADILRGEMYPLYEDNGNIHYAMGPMQYMPQHHSQYQQQYQPHQRQPDYNYDPPFYYNRPMPASPVQGYSNWQNQNSHPQIQHHPMVIPHEPSVPADETVNFMKQSHHFAKPSNYVMHSVNEPQYYMSDFYFVALVAGCTAVAVCAVLGFGICYYRLNKSKRDASDAEYPAYGVTGPNKDLSPGSADRKLAQSAHMYHYQHQKQQMIAAEKSSTDERHCSTSDVDSEEEGDEGHYTVYECPGLAPTGEMEVKNPLFRDEPTPASPGLVAENRTQ